MRVSPLGIFGVNHSLEEVSEWAREDAALTHIHPVCSDANALFAMGVAHAIRTGCDAGELYQRIGEWAEEMDAEPALRDVIDAANDAPPSDFMTNQGWVLVAFQNALWQLLHAPNLEEGVVDSVMRGGDTDTNAAICGALMGAVYGLEAVPGQWTGAVLSCRAEAGRPGVFVPRPREFWPVDALELAEGLVVG